MPKMKTHKGAKKRFSVTASGRVKRGHAKTSHILTKKSPKLKRKLRRSGLLATPGEEKMIKRLLVA